MYVTLFIFFLATFGCVLCQEEDDGSLDYLDEGVATSSGRILGQNTTFFGLPAKEYLGVPYAKPPVGDRRFKKPEPVDPWNGTLQADTMSPACVQYSEYRFPWYDSGEGKSEDCLYLNIWSSRFSPSRYKIPVMFWIHGGGFTVGSNRLYTENGLGLAVIGPAIVVSPNYRLGAEGYFSSGTANASGNLGMYDLVMALKWVRKNIAAFGGDPDRITIFGQGSGSVTVSLFLISPLTRGLFNNAIMQSGSFISTFKHDTRKHNMELAQRLAEAVDCASDNQTLEDDPKAVVDCLKGVDGNVMAKIINTFHPTSTTSFLPQYGDEFLPENPIEVLKKGDFKRVPLLIGNNKDEGSFLLTTENPEVCGVYGEKDPKIDRTEATAILRRMFGDQDPDPSDVEQQYLYEVDDSDYNEIRRQVYTAAGDYHITCPTMYFAEQYSDGNTTVEYYVFGQRPSLSPWARWMGSVHHDEVYVFGSVLAGYTYPTFVDFYNSELGLSYVMIPMWGNFAKEGRALKEWKNYSKTHHQYILLEAKAKKRMHGPGPHLDNCNFFRNFYGF